MHSYVFREKIGRRHAGQYKGEDHQDNIQCRTFPRYSRIPNSDSDKRYDIGTGLATRAEQYDKHQHRGQ